MFNLLALLRQGTDKFFVYGQMPKPVSDQSSPLPKIIPDPPTYEVKDYERIRNDQPEKDVRNNSPTKEKKKESCADILFYANMMRYHCTRDGKIQDFQHRELQDLDCPSKFFDRFVEMKKIQLPRQEYLRYQQMCQVYGEDYFEQRSSTSPEGRSM